MAAMEKWECNAFQFRNTVQVASMQFWKIAGGVASGLAHMHSLNVLHLDLHAENVFIRQVELPQSHIASAKSEAEETPMNIQA